MQPTELGRSVRGPQSDTIPSAGPISELGTSYQEPEHDRRRVGPPGASARRGPLPVAAVSKNCGYAFKIYITLMPPKTVLPHSFFNARV